MALGLVARSSRALAEQLNRYYRVLKGVDPDSVAIRLPAGGYFEIRDAAAGAPLLRVTNTGLDMVIGGEDIADNSITSAKIAPLTIQGIDIANGTITSDKLVTGAPITPGSITTAEIANGTILDADINAAANIAGTKLAANAVTQSAVAVGTTSGPQTISGSPTQLPEMVVALATTGGPLLISFAGVFSHSAVGGTIAIDLNVDGGAIFTARREVQADIATNKFSISATVLAPTVAAGTRTIAINWLQVGGTATAFATQRSLSVVELKR